MSVNRHINVAKDKRGLPVQLVEAEGRDTGGGRPTNTPGGSATGTGFVGSALKSMSRAFVKETDDAETLPEREISRHPNYVTPLGLKSIDSEVVRLSRLLAEARGGGDMTTAAAVSRDLRYWQRR